MGREEFGRRYQFPLPESKLRAPSFSSGLRLLRKLLFSADLEAVVSGNGTPPGPLDIDIVVGSTDETTRLFTQDSEEDSPSADAETGLTDYFWTIPANALTAISSSGTATVTISSGGSDNYVPITETFTVDW